MADNDPSYRRQSEHDSTLILPTPSVTTSVDQGETEKPNVHSHSAPYSSFGNPVNRTVTSSSVTNTDTDGDVPVTRFNQSAPSLNNPPFRSIKSTADMPEHVRNEILRSRASELQAPVDDAVRDHQSKKLRKSRELTEEQSEAKRNRDRINSEKARGRILEWERYLKEETSTSIETCQTLRAQLDEVEKSIQGLRSKLTVGQSLQYRTPYLPNFSLEDADATIPSALRIGGPNRKSSMEGMPSTEPEPIAYSAENRAAYSKLLFLTTMLSSTTSPWLSSNLSLLKDLEEKLHTEVVLTVANS
ncbi:uncharacterized protein IL334_007622 [Kwoniella shivajii]|uniref:BZIP domain-containing protein n=1 Tax=Kwoniella shivajii TaxID=564305 RepID=A0ABZ1DBE9_9TREE|nr:hypothetical protein IL334_007622 [Kwoniella shivajii]